MGPVFWAFLMLRLMFAVMGHVMRGQAGGRCLSGIAKEHKLIAIGLAAFAPERAEATGGNQLIAGPLGGAPGIRLDHCHHPLQVHLQPVRKTGGVPQTEQMKPEQLGIAAELPGLNKAIKAVDFGDEIDFHLLRVGAGIGACACGGIVLNGQVLLAWVRYLVFRFIAIARSSFKKSEKYFRHVFIEVVGDGELQVIVGRSLAGFIIADGRFTDLQGSGHFFLGAVTSQRHQKYSNFHTV